MLNRIKRCLILWFNLSRVSRQIVRGAWRISLLPQPVVSLFGGGRISRDNYYFEQVMRLVQRLVDENISVLTGGGPGLMEAAHLGAGKVTKGRGSSLGIGVADLPENPSPYVEDYIQLDYFFARKWLLTRYSRAFVVFPGGIGTLDELTEVLTLIATNRIGRVPVVLVGIDYWTELLEWLKNKGITQGLVLQEHLALLTLTDDLDTVFDLLRGNCSNLSSVEKDEQEQ